MSSPGDSARITSPVDPGRDWRKRSSRSWRAEPWLTSVPGKEPYPNCSPNAPSTSSPSTYRRRWSNLAPNWPDNTVWTIWNIDSATSRPPLSIRTRSTSPCSAKPCITPPARRRPFRLRSRPSNLVAESSFSICCSINSKRLGTFTPIRGWGSAKENWPQCLNPPVSRASRLPWSIANLNRRTFRPFWQLRKSLIRLLAIW